MIDLPKKGQHGSQDNLRDQCSAKAPALLALSIPEDFSEHAGSVSLTELGSNLSPTIYMLCDPEHTSLSLSCLLCIMWLITVTRSVWLCLNRRYMRSLEPHHLS